MRRMKKYIDPKTGREVPNGYDYVDFTRTLFQNQLLALKKYIILVLIDTL